MRILLYNPDNGVTRNFMPHLWMFLLQALTPPGHKVILVDGNTNRMDEKAMARFVRERRIDLVGIGSMTRMIAKAYRMADAIRAVGVPVVIGGPHVTEMPDEALGRNGGPRHADAVALGEADELWPRIVEDAARGQLQEIYAPVDEAGKERKPGLGSYPVIPWESLDLNQFNLVPRAFRQVLSRVSEGFGTFRLIPIETGRGCPYGCEFCTVTGFFGDSIRFRDDQSVVDEFLRLKRRAKQDGGQIFVFLVDDNFAINPKRTKKLLREIIDAGAQMPFVAQISVNLLRDEELVDLLAAAGARTLYIGLESIDPSNLADVAKGFNKPAEYGAVMDRLSRRNIIPMFGFIFGMDFDTPGVAARTLEQMRSWPPGLPIFSHLVPFPSTPLYARLQATGRLTRPKHWLNFSAFTMAHTPLKMTIEQVHDELREAWSASYSAEANALALDMIPHKTIGQRLTHFIARLFFRGIYFPQMTRFQWVRLIAENRRSIFKLSKEVLDVWQPLRFKARRTPNPQPPAPNLNPQPPTSKL